LTITVSRPLGALIFLVLALGRVQEPTPVLGQAAASLATVRGQVREHETGRALEGATVSLASGPEGAPEVRSRVTGPDGAFMFPDMPAGLYRITASLVGFTDLRDTLRVAGSGDLNLVLPLSGSPVQLAPIVVVADRRIPGPLVGFEIRRQTVSGVFFSRDEIEALGPHEFTDLLRRVPGVRVVPTSSYGHRIYLRGGCEPELWVDGARVGSTPDLDSFLEPSHVEAVEVYDLTTLPAEFGPSNCGAVVVWTRRGEPEVTGNSKLRQFAIAAGFVVVSWLLSRF
jgi:hypothetical protein